MSSVISNRNMSLGLRIRWEDSISDPSFDPVQNGRGESDAADGYCKLWHDGAVGSMLVIQRGLSLRLSRLSDLRCLHKSTGCGGGAGVWS